METIYHGTNQDFDILKSSDIDNQHEFYGNAVYFSDNIDVAKHYGKIIFKLDIDDNNFVVLDAKLHGIKFIGEEIKQLILSHQNIKVINVYDSNLIGAQAKRLPFKASIVDDYKYILSYFLDSPIKRITSDIKQKISQAQKLGIVISITGLGKEKSLYKSNLSYQQAEKLSDIGFNIQMSVGKTPPHATTYVITDDTLLEKAQKMLEIGGFVRSNTFRLDKSVQCNHVPTMKGKRCSVLTLNGNALCHHHHLKK